MTRRRRLRVSRPIPAPSGDEGQPTIPLHIVSANDWRSDSEVHAVKIRTTWGQVLATRERAVDSTGQPLRFIPAAIAEIMTLWYQLGGAQYPTRVPLLVVRLSHSGLAPLLLISLAALMAMENSPEIADRLRVAIEVATCWAQDRGPRHGVAATALLLLDSGSSFPILVPVIDGLQETPPPFRAVDLERDQRQLERWERREQFD